MAKQIRLVFIGAGRVNFGGGEGPWNHAARFERIPDVRCVGVADVDLPKAEGALAARRAGPYAEAWAETRAFGDWRQMIEQLRPDAAVVGLTPMTHGHADPPRDIEIGLARAGVAMLVEKPLSNADPAVVAKVADELRAAGAIVSVAYMFRYSAAIQEMRKVLAAAPGGPKVLLARYDCAYSEIASANWWDITRCGGPIVEQATHFLDLARYLCGEVELDSVQVKRIKADDPAGALTDLPAGPDGRPIDIDIPLDRRVPRATLAQWRFQSGAIGSLAHAVLLHDKKYESAIEVWSDGVRCILADPYNDCRLGVRVSGDEETHWRSFDDDSYLAEDQAFIEAVRTGDASGIRSSYDDALETYRLSWQITQAPD